jgi:spoIIIJ-associated protein
METEEGQAAAAGSPNGADPGAIAQEFLEELLRAMGFEAEVVARAQGDDTYRLEMQGPEMGGLIGRQGSTLGALQYLLTLVVNRRSGQRVRLVLDAEGYRSRREESLRQNALDLAGQVKESGQECVLDPMSAFDRRIVHTALAGNPDIYTYSEGEEPERCVVISPRSSQSDASPPAD